MTHPNSESNRPRPRGRVDSRAATKRETDVESGEWYWDRRTEKIYYARRTSEETVEFVSVWHREEAADALRTGAIVDLDEMEFDRSGATFALKESFRTPPASDLQGEE